MTEAGPTRSSADLADVVELLLDKGLVVNADIAVSIGDTELLGIRVRAAVASFETAAQYGLEFPEGTDSERIEQVANRGRLTGAAGGGDTVDAVDGPPAGTTDVSIAGPIGDGPAAESSGDEADAEPAVRPVDDADADADADADDSPDQDVEAEPAPEDGGDR